MAEPKIVELPSYEVQEVIQPEERNSIQYGRINAATEIQDGTIFANKLVVGAQTWVHNIVWTATDYNTASWSTGTINFSDGRSFDIASGNTGNITDPTYIYFDENNPTVLQTSTVRTDAIGDSKILLAIAEDVADTDASCVIQTIASFGTTIDGEQIVTGSITSVDGNSVLDLNNGYYRVSDGSNGRVRLGYFA